MIKYISIAALTLLGSCTSVTGMLTPSQIALVDQVQAGAIKACAFAPSVSSVVSLFGPIPTGVADIVAAICAAIPVIPAAAKGAAPVRTGQPAQLIVKGVVVNGVYTK